MNIRLAEEPPYQDVCFRDRYRISIMSQADIDLTDDERTLFGQITFDWDAPEARS
jgi:hypothetical protein